AAPVLVVDGRSVLGGDGRHVELLSARGRSFRDAQDATAAISLSLDWQRSSAGRRSFPGRISFRLRIAANQEGTSHEACRRDFRHPPGPGRRTSAKPPFGIAAPPRALRTAD